MTAIRTAFIALLSASTLAAQRAPDSRINVELRLDAAEPKTAAAAVTRVKAFYFSQDYEGGVAAAEGLLKRFPSSTELRAWQVVSMVRLLGRENEAKAIADSAALWSGPQSRWRDFALAFAWYNQRGGEAKSLEHAKKFRATAPWNRDALWLNVHLLNGAGKYDEVVALADSSIKRQAPWGELLVVKANALASASNAKADTAKRRQAVETFAQARQAERNNLNAHFLPAANLSSGATDTASFALMAAAASMTPAVTVHRRYWDAVRNRRDLSAAAKDSIITQDLDAMLALRPNSSSVLRAAHDAFVTMKRWDRQAPLLERLKAEFPNTVDLTWVEYSLLRVVSDSVFYKTTSDSAGTQQRWLAKVNEMASRPRQLVPGIYGTLLLYQWSSIEKDSTISADSLLRFGKTLAQFNTANPHRTHMDVPLLVAERKGDFRWAERMLLQGDSIRLASAERFKENMVRSEGVGAYADQLDYIKAGTRAGLGWVYMHEGRYDDAERELNKALDLQRKDPRIFYNFGRLAELRGNLPEAQAQYARGYPLEQFFTGFKNRDALKRLYAVNHGSMDGFEPFVEKLKEEDRVRRKEKIASERATNGDPMPAFSLERYTSNRVPFASDSLKGRVAVVNFWGVWCGPCVKEIPDIQKVHEALKGDTNVVFLTVDYDDTPEKLADFMVKKKLDFPVLFDAERFARDRAKISAYPTTLFIDKQGRIAFKKVGASDFVFEEFLWRVEMLKGAKP